MKKKIDINIGKTIRFFRKKNKLSVKELALLIDVPYQKIYRLESGITKLNTNDTINLIKVLNTTWRTFNAKFNSIDQGEK